MADKATVAVAQGKIKNAPHSLNIAPNAKVRRAQRLYRLACNCI